MSCHTTSKVFSYFLDVTKEKQMIIFRYQCISNKKHSENADTSTSVTFIQQLLTNRASKSVKERLSKQNKTSAVPFKRLTRSLGLTSYPKDGVINSENKLHELVCDYLSHSCTKGCCRGSNLGPYDPQAGVLTKLLPLVSKNTSETNAFNPAEMIFLTNIVNSILNQEEMYCVTG